MFGPHRRRSRSTVCAVHAVEATELIALDVFNSGLRTSDYIAMLAFALSVVALLSNLILTWLKLAANRCRGKRALPHRRLYHRRKSSSKTAQRGSGFRGSR